MSKEERGGFMVTKPLWLIAGVAALAGAAFGAWRFSGGGVVTAGSIFKDMVGKIERERRAKPWPKEFEKGHSNPYKLLDVKVEDWVAADEGRAAHAIKIPNPVPEDSGYRKGKTQQEYFEHLCKTEAGEFIFKTVDNVDGIYQVRPRKVYSSEELQHLYAIEDPYGYYAGENESLGEHYVSPILYSYFEIPVGGRRIYGLGMKALLHPSVSADPPASATIARYYNFDNWSSHDNPLKLEYASERKARYAFTWRGIKRPHDREMGIAGGELIVLDLETKEVLGVRRGYVVWNRGWTARVCPRYGYGGGQDKTARFSAWFLVKVARPPRWEEYLAKEEKYRVQAVVPLVR
jgi:hypothetical protein